MSFSISKLPVEFKQALKSELSSGETILYAGRPDWRAGWAKGLAAFLFGTFWSAIAFTFFGAALAGLFGFATIKSGNGPASTGLLLFTLLFSLPFVAIGCAFLAAPAIGIQRSKRTIHIVTSERVLDLTLSPHSVESYSLKSINFVRRWDRKDGHGTLQIAYGIDTDADGATQPLTLDWTGIPDVQAAERAIRDSAPWARSPPLPLRTILQ